MYVNGEVLLISIHIPRVGDDDLGAFDFDFALPISIHIPRVGDDDAEQYLLNGFRISIHIPRVGDDN